jgi:hypothetical protein
VSSRRLEPEIQNTLQQGKWHASARAATFGFSRGSMADWHIQESVMEFAAM